MTCETIVDAPGITVIVCRRGARRPSCSTTGCHKPASRQCDHAVARKGVTGTCDRDLCEGCAVRVAESVDRCPPHARAVKAAP